LGPEVENEHFCVYNKMSAKLREIWPFYKADLFHQVHEANSNEIA